jgi:hypothetical protein
VVPETALSKIKMKITALSLEAFDAKRRALLRALTATAAALAVARCGGGGSDATNAAPAPGPGPVPGPVPGPGPATNVAPVWASIPAVQFTQGVASSFPLGSFVSDANGDALVITMNAVTLPAGVTFDAAGKRLVYDGNGAAASVNAVQMTADDGRT